jgi:hypothetical protein
LTSLMTFTFLIFILLYFRSVFACKVMAAVLWNYSC